MYIFPCHGCPLRNGCEQKKKFISAITGTGVTSAKFRCNILADEMRPGRRVVIDANIYVQSHEYYDGDFRRKLRATILDVCDGYAFTSILDESNFSGNTWSLIKSGMYDPKKARMRRRLRHTRIVSFLDEPDRTPADMLHEIKQLQGGLYDQ